MSALDKQEGGDHYRMLNPQPAAVLRAWNVNHLEGEAIYRILRHQNKNGRDDLLKAIHTLELILELDYSEKPWDEMISAYNPRTKPWDASDTASALREHQEPSHDIKAYIDSLNRGWTDGQTAFKSGAVKNSGT